MASDILENQQEVPDLTLGPVDEDLATMAKASVHVGHIPSKTHPKMAAFIYGQKGGVAIFDLVKTKEKLASAEEFLKKLAREGKTILFAGTKPAARKYIKRMNEQFDAPVVFDRWIGGTLTNSKNIIGRVQRLTDLLHEKATGGFSKYTKKEAMLKDEEITHLEKTFGGLRKLKRLPDALFLADIDEDELAVREAIKMKVPIVAITNSNTDPPLVHYPIPANDTSTHALEYIFTRIEKTMREGRAEAKPPEPTEK